MLEMTTNKMKPVLPFSFDAPCDADIIASLGVEGIFTSTETPVSAATADRA